MYKILLALVFVTFGSQVFAEPDHGDHSETVCSTVDAKVCAHLGHMTALNSRDEVQFVAHVLLPATQAVSNMKVSLWMPSMGHGSSPVKLTQIDVNKYQVSEAFFMMPGTWVVRLNFTFNGANHQINIPVNVAE